MKNIPTASAQGPSPATLTSLSPARRRVLAAVAGSPEIGVPELAAQLGTHPNSVRQHLQRLLADGYVTQRARPATGRGRPAHLYCAVGMPAAVDGQAEAGGTGSSDAIPDPVTEEYLGLAGAFAEHLAHTASEPSRAARSVGRFWGGSLAGRRSAHGDPAASTARSVTIAILERLGFSPQDLDDREDEREEGLILLRTCPLLSEARRRPEVICQVHRGLVEGAMEGLGGTSDGIDLVPFAAPGACHLTMPRTAIG